MPRKKAFQAAAKGPKPTQKEIDDFVRAAGNWRDDAFHVFLKKYGMPHIDAYASYGGTALGCAAYYGRIDLAKMLLKAGADINRRDRHIDWTPLMSAARAAEIKMVAFLCDNGADPYLESKDGETAEMLAARFKEGLPMTRADTVSFLKSRRMTKEAAEESARQKALDSYVDDGLPTTRIVKRVRPPRLRGIIK